MATTQQIDELAKEANNQRSKDESEARKALAERNAASENAPQDEADEPTQTSFDIEAQVKKAGTNAA